MENQNTQSNPNENLVISSYGNGIAVGIEGSEEQINRQFNRFFNHGAAGKNCSEDFCNEAGAGSNYLHFTSDNFAYFLSDDQSMILALLNEKLTNLNRKSIDTRQAKGKKKGLFNELKSESEKEFNSIKKENFMNFNKNESVKIYQKLDGGASHWDRSSVSLAESVLM